MEDFVIDMLVVPDVKKEVDICSPKKRVGSILKLVGRTVSRNVFSALLGLLNPCSVTKHALGIPITYCLCCRR